jgi:hypothetical protein
VPKSHKENEFSLGSWVTEQRGNQEKMPSKRRQRLHELVFVWDAREVAWENGFNYLKIYKDRNGHCQVPKTYKEDDFELGSWVSVQRGNKNQMSSERQQRLNELGFLWKPQKGPLPRKRQ